jgi:hypothetical protein
MFVPGSSGSAPEIIESVEHSKLHVGMNPVHEGHAPVAEVEHERVLVGHVGRAEDDCTVRVDNKARTVDSRRQTVCSDLPRFARTMRGETRVCHNHVVDTVAANNLHPGVFDGVDVALGPQDDRVKPVTQSVTGHKQQHIADVIQKAWARARHVGRVSLPDATDKQQIATVVMKQAGVEKRAVAGHRAWREDGPIAEPFGLRSWNQRGLGRWMHERFRRVLVDVQSLPKAQKIHESSESVSHS